MITNVTGIGTGIKKASPLKGRLAGISCGNNQLPILIY
jgi:hypothetical protein